jgi:LPXTG-motif cell wall-anchored protein
MKKLISLVLALAMIMMVGAAFAADPATNNPAFDTTVQITNLDEGDSVTLYQIIEWDGFWKPATGSGLNQDDVDDIVGQNHETGAKTHDPNLSQTYIDKIIASTALTKVDGPTTIDSTKTYSFTTTKAGMFYAVVTPKDGTKVYKPIFISSDYSATNATHTISTAAKFETITIDKKATGQTNNHDKGANYDEASTDANSYNTVNVGDTVDFEIDTTIPKFPVSFTSPVFKVSDTLNGLALVTGEGKIKVYAGETLLTEGSQYTLNPTPTSTTFTVDFDSDYIKGLTAAQPIKVVYQGVVDNTATYEINMKENKAEVRFSNNPSDDKGANKLVDETRHYTFDINGIISGEANRPGTDLIKVGIDDQGNEITQTIQLPNKHWAGALQGAKFTLYGDEQKTTTIRTNLESDANGQIVITGLDAGTYWLEETEAPAGFIKSNKLAKIEIIPVFEKKTVAAHEETVEGITVTVPAYSYAVLKSYTIKINDKMTSTYTVKNEGTVDVFDDDQIAAGSASGQPTNDDLGKIQNPKGVELPSTGGIGTTIFYVVGSILVVAAGVLLITKKRMSREG